jgi:hypothetical protein
MIAGGNHTLTIATGKCIPLENSPAAIKKVRSKDEKPSVSVFLGGIIFTSGLSAGG